ncbi:anhydro-N-acetylmuramic acid kinase [compost metagenome]
MLKIPDSFETSRMMLRFLSIEDLPAVYRQFSDNDMCAYFSEPPCSQQEAQEIIEHYREPEGKGYLRYGMFDKDNGAFIGTCGYHYWDCERKQVEIGYDVWKQFWRQGYVSEALPELIRICFDHLGVDYIYILTHPQNQASIASVQKLGFTASPPLRNTEEEQLCMALMRSAWR